MDLGFSQDQEDLRASVRRFIEHEFPRDEIRSRLECPASFDAERWRRAAGLGWAGLLVPDALGGGAVTDQSLVDLYVLVEELGRHLQPWPVISTSVVAAAIGKDGSDEQRARYLTPLIGGAATAAWCVSGSVDLDVEPTVTITRTPAGYTISGTAPYALDALGADILLVDGSMGTAGVRLLVDPKTPGIEVVRRQAFDLTRRVDEIRFIDVFVSADAALAEESDAARDRLVGAALVIADSVGGQEAITQMATEYARIRVAFGRPIGSFQAIKHKLADMHCLLESSRATAYYAALAVNDGLPDAEYAVSAAKSYVNDAYVRMAHENIEIHGGTGFTWEHDAHLFLRRAMTNQLLFGDSKEHRERVFALASDEQL